MKRFVAMLLTVRKTLNILLILAVAVVILVDFVLSDVPELLPGAARNGSLVHALSLAFTSTYIFYFIVVHSKQISDRANIEPYVAKKTRQIVKGIREITLQIILHKGNDPKEKYPSREQLEDMCKKVDPNGPAPRDFRNALSGMNNWVDFLMYWKRTIEERLSHIFRQSHHLESAHMRILLRRQGISFFSVFDVLPRTARNTDLTFLSSAIYDLSESAKSVQSDSGKHF